MGLDMFLFSMPKTRDMAFQDALNLEFGKTVSESSMREVAYWRKANSIHNWFVKNVQEEDDCGYYEVTKGELRELLFLCDKVLKNKDLAHVCLPTLSGFFFGSTEYDDNYFADIEETRKTLKIILEEFDESKNYLVYHSSW